MSMSRSELAARTVIVLAIVLAPFVFWEMFDVILVAIAAIVFGLVLRMLAEPLKRWLRLPESLALTVAGLLLLVVFGGAAYLFGARISAELSDVVSRAATAEQSIVTSLQGSQFGRLVMAHMSGGGVSLTSILSAFVIGGAGLAEAVVVAVIAGVYLAVDPSVYRHGLVQLFPSARRRNARETIEALETALRLWLLGQVIQMIIIGALSGLACWWLGLPSPFALGLIAGLCEFVPYVGPIISGVPALLVAAPSGLGLVLWTLGAYLLIHQFEGHIVVPNVQRRMLDIPPALMLLGIVIVSFVFGGAGLIFAAPLTVIGYVLTKKAYVRDTLQTETPLPGERGARSGH